MNKSVKCYSNIFLDLKKYSLTALELVLIQVFHGLSLQIYVSNGRFHVSIRIHQKQLIILIDIDDKWCSMSTIDRLFIATNVEMVELEDNPDRDLCRYEFYEIIVRMADERYRKSGDSLTLPEAVERMITENVDKFSNFVLPWQSWRSQELWTLRIDDLFRANLDTLK